MDLSTVERKLQSSNPSKPDPNLANPRYRNADEFVKDIKLIFNNTITFNGPDHLVSQYGKRLEAVFDKSAKHMPPPAEVRRVIIVPIQLIKAFSAAKTYRQERTTATPSTRTCSVSAVIQEASRSSSIHFCPDYPPLRY